jgi:hypothetical protein
MEQFESAPVITTVPVGTIPAPLTVTLTDTDWPGADGSGASAVIVVTVKPLLTVWFSVSELVVWLESPLYIAVRFLEPVVLKITLQLPFPPESVMVQFLSAPVMSTVPVGTVPASLTVTLTATDWPGMDGSGVSAVMIVELGVLSVETEWISVSQLSL